MMVADRMSVDDLATSLTEVLDRAQSGEHIAVERDGMVIATIGPPPVMPGTTWGEFLAACHSWPRPDGFADDLEAVHASTRASPGITVAELIAKVGDLEMPGDGFADDLEAIQAEQGIAEMPEWPD